ncbi:unnamed protein product [Pleuronectes platessa]|uniref:Uncharacterized protein n=1 Tax=Pleuronectes platessa TaxID=8262 RepID=A0A9N7VMP5_PLEPL|nr:unnamed protein product [Pleuronectes platessa]
MQVDPGYYLLEDSWRLLLPLTSSKCSCSLSPNEAAPPTTTHPNPRKSSLKQASTWSRLVLEEREAEEEVEEVQEEVGGRRTWLSAQSLKLVKITCLPPCPDVVTKEKEEEEEKEKQEGLTHT